MGGHCLAFPITLLLIVTNLFKKTFITSILYSCQNCSCESFLADIDKSERRWFLHYKVISWIMKIAGFASSFRIVTFAIIALVICFFEYLLRNERTSQNSFYDYYLIHSIVLMLSDHTQKRFRKKLLMGKSNGMTEKSGKFLNSCRLFDMTIFQLFYTLHLTVWQTFREK